MADPDDGRLGPVLTRFGQTIADEAGRPPQRAYAFVYGEDNWAQFAVYVDEGEAVRLIFPDELFDISTEIWRVENGKRAKPLRWVYFEYDIQDGKFDAHFFYPEEIASGTGPLDWENAGVRQRFGNKRVIQPDIPTVDDPPQR